MSKSQSELEKRLARIRDAVDMELVGDNISDIAEFTLEKFEFRTGSTLSPRYAERRWPRSRTCCGSGLND